jgi:hypothetical protein
MYRAWYESDRLFTEFYRESNDLAAALRDTLFALQPLQPETVLLLRDLLLSSETLPEGGFTLELSPGALSRTMSPFAARTVSPEAIERLLEWFEPGFLPLHNPYKQTVSKQLALLALSNVSNLSPAQREALWRVGYAAPDMLTRSLTCSCWGVSVRWMSAPGEPSSTCSAPPGSATIVNARLKSAACKKGGISAVCCRGMSSCCWARRLR